MHIGLLDRQIPVHHILMAPHVVPFHWLRLVALSVHTVVKDKEECRRFHPARQSCVFNYWLMV